MNKYFSVVEILVLCINTVYIW